MTGRERLLTAINNGKPDHLPCQVHSWMQYYLNTYLNGRDQFEAYEYFGMDPVIYMAPDYIYSDKDLKNWVYDQKISGTDKDGVTRWTATLTTPGGVLTGGGAYNKFTSWSTKHLIITKEDFEIWNKYVPVPVKVDWTPVSEAKKRIGDKGIVRSWPFDFGQGSPFQSFAILYGTEPAIFAAMDEPDWLHYVLKSILDKKLKAIEAGGKNPADLIETGGGAGSNTVISPAMHREFCLPYDIVQHKAIHESGPKIVYHLCGGHMKLLETIVENGADCLETMTPSSMGADCNIAEAAKRVGDKLAFIGGFDQNAGFENGTPENIKKQVRALFEAKPKGGLICSPSDHFFFGDPENIRTFVKECRNCKY